MGHDFFANSSVVVAWGQNFPVDIENGVEIKFENPTLCKKFALNKNREVMPKIKSFLVFETVELNKTY